MVHINMSVVVGWCTWEDHHHHQQRVFFFHHNISFMNRVVSSVVISVTIANMLYCTARHENVMCV